MPYTFPDKAIAPDAASAASALGVTNCPFCKSSQVTTTSKIISSSSYWRCHTCGEIWNPGRAENASRFSRPRW
jgi:transposase-like protein